MQDDKEKQKPIATGGEPQEVDYNALDIAEPESKEVDYSTLPIPSEPEKKKEEPIVGPSESAKEPLQLITQAEIEKKIAPVSSTIQPVKPIQTELPQDEESQRKYFEIDNNFKQLSQDTKIPVENLMNAAEILTVKPSDETLPTGYGGSLLNGLYEGVGSIAYSLSGAHQLVQKALGLKITPGFFGDIANVYKGDKEKYFNNIPDDAMSGLLQAAGNIIPDVALAEVGVPELGSYYLAKLTKNTIKAVPKFAAYLGAKETFSTYAETEDVIESIKGGLEGFKTGLYYQALGIAADEVGGVVSKLAANEKLGAYSETLAQSLLFGSSSMVESGKYDVNTFLQGAGLGLGFSAAKLKSKLESSAERKMLMSYFTSSPEMEREAMESKKTNTELRREAIDLRLKAKASQSDMERTQYLTAAAKLENYIGIRGVMDFIKQSPETIIESVQNDQSLSPNESDYYSKKIMESYMNNNENLKKVKPQIDEINKLGKRIDEIDKMEIPDAEKEVLKKEPTVRIAELQSIIDSKLKIGEQPSAPAEEEGMKKVEPIVGKVEEVKPRERFTEAREAEFEHTFDLRDQKIMLTDKIDKLNKVIEEQKGETEFKPTEIEEGLPGKKKTTKLSSKEEIINLVNQSKERLDIVDNELKRREGEEILEEGPMKIGRKAYTDKDEFLSDLRKMRDFENIPGGVDVPPDMYKEVNEILDLKKYEIGITTATKGLGEIGKQLDKAQKLFDEGKFDKANKIYAGILDQGHKKLSELFNDVSDIEIRLAQTKGTFFKETEPTFDYEIIDKGDNLDIIKERLVNLGEEWKQKNVHVSIRMNTLPKGVKIGEELEDGSVHEWNFDINFGEQLSDQQYKDLLDKIDNLKLPGATLKREGKVLNLYNISKFENYEQYGAKIDQLAEYLKGEGLGTGVDKDFRKIWIYGKAEGGATRSYEEVRSEVRGRKAKSGKIGEELQNASSRGTQTKGLGKEKGGETRIGEVGENGVRNASEDNKLEAGPEPQKEISTEKPIIVKEGINLFGLTVDDNAITKLWKENLTSRGYLPVSVFREWASTQGRIKAELYKANYLVADLRRAMRKAYGKTFLGTPKISKEEREKLNSVLQDMGAGKRYEALQDVPESLHESLLAIRDHVDALSRELIRSGVTEGMMKAIITENLGYYMTRTYRAHNDKEWKWENIDDGIKNSAISWMRAEYPDYTDDQINVLLKEWIYQKDGPLGFVQKGKLGSKDLGILMKRKGIPVELRDLLGEYKDPMYNYSTSVSKMANLIERQKFLEFVRNDGMGKYLFEFKDLKDAKNFVRIAAEKSSVMEPLNGLYTTPEIAKAFEAFGKSDPISGITRAYLKYINVPVKYGKTILSPVTHARNYYANYWFHVANGRYFFIKEIPKAHATMWNDLVKRDNQEFRDYMQKLVKYNVIGESTRAGEVHDAIADATRYTEEFDKYGDSLFKKVGRKTLKGAEKLYQIEDDVHKIIAFEYERKRYESVIKKQNQDKSEADINDLLDQKAAELVRKTMATYSLVPKLIKSLRRFPLVGTFVSFPAEVIRTYTNTLQLSIEEMKNPDTRDIGITRLSGLLAASTATATMATSLRYLVGVDKQDDNDLKRYLPPWSKNSDIMIIKDKGSGVYSYVDLGFSDPYNYVKKPVNAFLRGEDWKDAALQSIKELAQPFLGEELVASKLIDIARNTKKDSKTQIYNPELSYGDQLQQKWEYLWGGIQPGVVYQGKRIAKSFSEKADEYGLSPENEFMNLFFGLRSNNIDINRAFGFKVYHGGNRLNDAQNIYRKVLYNKLAGDKEKQKALETANNAVESVIMDLHEDYRAAIRLGVDKKELFNKLDNMSIEKLPVGRKVRTYIMKGEFRGLDERTGKIK